MLADIRGKLKCGGKRELMQDRRNIETGALTRRTALLGLSAFTLSGCMVGGREVAFDQEAVQDMMPVGTIRPKVSVDANIQNPNVMYSSFADGGFTLPAIPFQKVDPKWRRQIVVDPTGEKPGTIVVHSDERHLYLVQEGGDAIRYGVGIGRDGFAWKGRAMINHGKEWPVWTPPKEMIARKPEVAKWANGQPGGLDNPLGARAMYIYQNGSDTGYRVHGSPEWNTIGQAMSSGCVRMINQDVIDLYRRVHKGSPIVVV
jgi:lipoprotein-anchoring transpeptidase ErfK/SrfK